MSRARLAGTLCLISLTNSAAAQSTVDVYTYDALGRLVSAQIGTGAKTSYSFDQASNRSSVKTQRQFDTSWEGESLPHQIGYAEFSGWAANVTNPTGALTYGPYTNGVPVGARVATWRMMVDVNTVAATDAVAGLDVYDATAGEIIAGRALTWSSFAAPYSYQAFELPFTVDASRAGHLFEFRTWYYARAYINLDKVGYY